MKQYIFFYLISATTQALRVAAPYHARYWADKLLSGGPFVDFSGGFITFEAESAEKAAEIVSKDPFVVNKILSNSWLKEWLNG